MNGRKFTEPLAAQAYIKYNAALFLLLKAQREMEAVIRQYTEDVEEAQSWQHLREAIGQFEADRESVCGLLEEQSQNYREEEEVG
jgi:hypothetical protein